MFASLSYYFARGSPESHSPPPPYQTVESLPPEQPQAFENTPRRWFDYHIDLRKKGQVAQWGRAYIDKGLYGDSQSQDDVARIWVIMQWQQYRIWVDGWPPTGPGYEEKWKSGAPMCLATMEFAWEVEHIAWLKNPVLIPVLAADETDLPADSKPLQMDAFELFNMALNAVQQRWADERVSSQLIQSTVQYRQDLPELYNWLPKPAVEKLISSEKIQQWSDLSCGTAERVRNPTTDLLGFPLPDEDDRVEEQLPRSSRASAAQQNATAATRANVDSATGAATPGRRARASRRRAEQGAIRGGPAGESAANTDRGTRRRRQPPRAAHRHCEQSR
ncbi:hypothetical protein PWT90_03510 [Aphanocladium album]|nr:hypothetical protein PWT90_03510 [Aphanocladium album]